MINLDQKIKVCPSCKGWGRLSSEQEKDCDECSGEGVYIQSGRKVKVFGLPLFADFGARQKRKIIKALLSIGIILIIIIIFLVIILT